MPFNTLLSKKFDAHINVEICSSVRGVGTGGTGGPRPPLNFSTGGHEVTQQLVGSTILTNCQLRIAIYYDIPGICTFLKNFNVIFEKAESAFH